MAYLRHQEAHEHFRDHVLEGLKEHFPIEGRLQSLHLDRLEVDDTLHPDDIRAQHQAKMDGETWAAPVYATLTLKDNRTGQTVDKRRMKVAEIPQITRRYSYIVGGKEYQLDNQWQLKPGIYTQRKHNGELATQFNILGRTPFEILFHPDTKQFVLEYNDSKLPLYPFMKTMGVSDEQLEKTWGKEVLEANKSVRRVGKALDQFVKTTKSWAKGPIDPEQHVRQVFAESRLNPDATELTVGKRLDRVTGEALHLATDRLLKVQRGAKEDDRDSIVFKNLRSIGDYAYDALRGMRRDVKNKVDRKINTAKNIRDILKFETINSPFRKLLFTENAAARVASQINPAEMVSAAMQTTILGPGGIQSEDKVTEEAKLINPSHFGFIDPVSTPEGSKTGITLRLAAGVRKIGNEAKIPLYNLKTGKVEDVDPKKVLTSKVVLADQVRWSGDKPVALQPQVKMMGANNEPTAGSMKDADYVMRRPSHFLSMTTNLIPFVNNTNGARAGYASRHIEQAISLVNREAPLVQAGTGLKGDIDTFDKLMGSNAAHRAPVAGMIVKIEPNHVLIKDAKGKTHEVQLYNHFPLNDAKSMLHSEPVVRVGDKVKEGQVVADTNFSKKGVLALGANLRVGFLPYKGYNFEDGLVISQSAADKLTSQHMHKHEMDVAGAILDPRRFRTLHGGAFTRDQYGLIGDDGVVKVGAKVKPGDPLIVAMKPYQLRDASNIAKMRKSLAAEHTDASLRWDGEGEGEVVAVHRNKDKIQVHVRTIEGMQIGDKMSNRSGGKGIVTAVLPDAEMPHTKDGKPIDVAFNCSGIPGRMNVGQVLEVAAGKIAQKTGKTYIAEGFEPGAPDVLQRIQKELKQHGLSDTEELFDPVTGKSLGPVLVGPQHMLKLVHQVDKKISVRPGMSIKGVQREPQYSTSTLQPVGGGHVGGQSIGSLGVYALLAHGARANLREFQSYKSEGMTTQASATKGWPSQHREIWAAIQQGTPLPPPKPTFAFHKFETMLKGAGINIEKKGHNFVLGPLTDKQILAMSAGEIKDPTKVVMSKVDEHNEPRPLAGGLFDEKITGGNGGVKWSHIKLSEPLPNPVFEGPIKHLTGLKGPEFEAIIYGQKAVSADGKIVPLGQGVTGGAAIKALLERIDVDRDLKRAEEQLKKAPDSKVDKTLKQVKYLQALKELGAKPSEAYMLHYLPVLPPSSRPLTVLPNGAIRFEDINGLYKEFGTVNGALGDKELRDKLSDKRKANLRNDFYDGVKAIMGVHIPYGQNKVKGLLHTISGASPKSGYFQDILVERKQDLTMRSTIVPEPALGLDEVGLPKHAALELFAPFVVRKLVELGGAKDTLDSQKKLGDVINGGHDPLVWKALEKTMDERPVLLKRDPALHSYSVQAFKAKAVGGNAIKIHPLVCSGYNADFDGDSMSVYVPITGEAVHEARKMHPSNNLFAEASGKLAYQPSHESIVGLFKLTSIGSKTNHKFDSIESAVEALGGGKVKYNDVVSIGGKPSTPGRALIASVLPEPMQAAIAHNMDLRLDTKATGKLLTELAKQHGKEFGTVVNKIKDIGNHAAFGAVKLPDGPGVFQTGAHTLSLKDFEADKVSRDAALRAAADKIKGIVASKSFTTAEKEHKAIQAWEDASEHMRKAHEARMRDEPNNLYLMYQAGVKPQWSQYKQMALAPMLMRDSQGKTIPMPVTRSYGEGLDISGYWTHLHGTRRGTVKKVQEVQEPGYLTKLMQNTAMHLHVVRQDCGTTNGISMHVSEPEVHDRVLQQDFKTDSVHVPAGTILSPDVVGVIRAADKNAQVVVRSPLRCEADQGLCAKCMGLSSSGQFHPIGTAVGVQAVHALGERAVQLTLKEFHTGGVAGVKGMTNSMDRLEQLTKLPERIPAAATLAMSGGKIDKIERDATGAKVWLNGVVHHIGKDQFGRSLATHEPGASMTLYDGKPWHPPTVGMSVEAGHVLSDPTRTIVNPRDVFKATGSIEKFQNHLSNEIFRLYKDEGVKRKHIEVLVKAMTSGTKVKDPGDSHLLRGQVYPLIQVSRLNQDLKGRRPVVHEPVIEGVTMLPHHLLEDWMAKLQHDHLRDTILDAAATLGKSNIHGVHPIPGLAYGAEFGRTQADAKKPGLGHLQDVPEHHY